MEREGEGRCMWEERGGGLYVRGGRGAICRRRGGKLYVRRRWEGNCM